MTMDKKPKTEALSGWYTSSSGRARELTGEEKKKEDEWFSRLIEGNYRRLPVEVPGSMMLALGRLALKKGVPFSDFVEGILAEYLKERGIDWRK